MKLVIAFFIVGFIGIVALIGVNASGMARTINADTDFLRLHIKANSNDRIDQDIKYLVKQRIVAEMTPILEGVTSHMEVIERLENEITNIEYIANTVIIENGKTYTARAMVQSAEFPTRSYASGNGMMTVGEGVFEALVLELGEARGDNWWCVVYPPLCFRDDIETAKSNVNFRFKLLEWFR